MAEQTKQQKKKNKPGDVKCKNKRENLKIMPTYTQRQIHLHKKQDAREEKKEKCFKTKPAKATKKTTKKT